MSRRKIHPEDAREALTPTDYALSEHGIKNYYDAHKTLLDSLLAAVQHNDDEFGERAATLTLKMESIRQDRRERRDKLSGEEKARIDALAYAAYPAMEEAHTRLETSKGTKVRSPYSDEMAARIVRKLYDSYPANDFKMDLCHAVTYDNLSRGQRPWLHLFAVEAVLDEISDDEPEDEGEPEGRWFGTEGERYDITLTVTELKRIPNNRYGDSILHKFKDHEGNVFVWFGSAGARSANTMEEGETWDVRATVKEHTTFNGTRQTKLTRVSPEDLR